MATVLERDALYYPKIKIGSQRWLKSTLLCFPHVRRIVPGGYCPDDQKWIHPFLQTEGIGGLPLLINENPYGDASDIEQVRLAREILKNEEGFRRQFSREATELNQPSTARAYRIHFLKFNPDLRKCLLNLNLAWNDQSDWYTLHPHLGRAVMATIAIAVANEKGYDIITNDESLHRSVCTQRQDDVFAELTGTSRNGPVQSSPELVDELAHVFVSTYFDASKLTIEQIVILQKEGKDLRRFKDAIAPIAQTIPDISDHKERQRRLKESAAEINREWKKYKKSLPRFAADMIFDLPDTKLPTAASIVLGASALTYLPFNISAGLAFGLVTLAGFRIHRQFQEKTDSPYKYLSSVSRAGATLLVPTKQKG
jgi:hypothetical protein